MSAPGPLLAIRADASHHGGTGHIMRTLAIAQTWLARGGRIRFLCAELPDALEQKILAASADVVRIDPENDAFDTAAAVTDGGAVALLVDHYDLTESWWRALPSSRRWKTASLNDFTVPIHPLADMRISPRAIALPGEPLSGPEFLPIRNEIRRADEPDSSPHRAQRVLLVLGGADPRNAGPQVATQVIALEPDVSLRAVVGPAATNLDAFQQLPPRVEVIHCPPSMLPHFLWADTAIVSPSTTAFETLHHGLPTGLVITADNQEEVAADLTKIGCALPLADARRDEWQLDASRLRELLHDEISRGAISAAGSALVDGMGAGRACDVLGLPGISFRSATADDAHQTWEWANDPDSRTASFSSDPIPWETHREWFLRRIASEDPVWIATAGEQAIGLVRFDAADKGIHTISINLSPSSRGRGWSALVIARAVAAFRSDHPQVLIHAWIKPSNEASRRAFARAGFGQEIDAFHQDRLLYINTP
jgi:spore coat polysaccharide biosynthesis predicted glycosyltransferase SpsG/L-amino acid N-acyltransferase YncA